MLSSAVGLDLSVEHLDEAIGPIYTRVSLHVKSNESMRGILRPIGTEFLVVTQMGIR